MRIADDYEAIAERLAEIRDTALPVVAQLTLERAVTIVSYEDVAISGGITGKAKFASAEEVRRLFQEFYFGPAPKGAPDA